MAHPLWCALQPPPPVLTSRSGRRFRERTLIGSSAMRCDEMNACGTQVGQRAGFNLATRGFSWVEPGSDERIRAWLHVIRCGLSWIDHGASWNGLAGMLEDMLKRECRGQSPCAISNHSSSPGRVTSRDLLCEKGCACQLLTWFRFDK